MYIYISLYIISQVNLGPAPPPEPDPRPPPVPGPPGPPPGPPAPPPGPPPAGLAPTGMAPAGPRVFVVRRGAPGAAPAFIPHPPAPVPPAEGNPVEILQEILRQQRVLRLQQDALQQQQQLLPLAAMGAPPPDQQVDGVPLPADAVPVAPLNALQEWQIQWQQQQQHQLRQMQPFLAEPVAAPADHRPRPLGLPPPPPPDAIRP